MYCLTIQSYTPGPNDEASDEEGSGEYESDNEEGDKGKDRILICIV